MYFLGWRRAVYPFLVVYIDPRMDQESCLSMHGLHEGGLGYIAREMDPMDLLILDLEISTR